MTASNPQPSDRRSADAVVIGGGLHGLSAALHMAMRGLEVVVVERGTVGCRASSANAGGVRRVGRHLDEIPLSLSSMKMWREMENLVGADCGFRQSGHIFLAETETDLKLIDDRLARMRALGHDHEVRIDARDVAAAVPGISDHVLGGLASWGDGYANPLHAVRHFRRRAEDLGVRVLEGTEIGSATRQAGTWALTSRHGTLAAPVVVNCAGAGGGKVAALFGDTIPVRAEAPMMMVTTPMPSYEGPVLGRIAGRFSMKGGANGSLLIGGGYRARLSPGAERAELDFSGLAKSAATLLRLVPGLASARLLRAWHGVEGYSPDGKPVIGAASGAPGVFHAFAFSGHGFQLVPAVGRVIAELICTGNTPVDLAAFSAERFNKPPVHDDVWTSSGLIRPKAGSAT